MNTYALIMAGGGGTRFWPLSRANLPKQVLNICGNDIMINETIKRYNSLISYDKTFIITNKQQKDYLEHVLIPNVPRQNVFLESESKNTAPCILISALKILKAHGDGVMCVFPSDHYISDEKAYEAVLKKCINLALNSDKLVTIGIKPTFPSTGYGYINFDPTDSRSGGFEVLEFVEKPNFETANSYYRSGNYLWNSGTFFWKISAILENFKRFLPRIYNSIYSAFDSLNTDSEQEVISQIYARLPSISIDYGILERTSDVLVVNGDFGWNDVGSWDSLGNIYPPDKEGNISKADHINIDSRNCIIYSNNSLIATVGIEDMIVVNVDDATLVCPKSRAQDVKKIVEKLREEKKFNLL